MKLSKAEYYTYLKVHHKLMFFAGRRTGLLEKELSFNDFLHEDFSLKTDCRNILVNDISHIYKFAQKYKDRMLPLEKMILNGFKNFVKGKFFLYKSYQEHSIFLNLNSGLFFKVYPLIDNFPSILPQIPCYLYVVLLPLKNIIIYDGFLLTSEVEIEEKIIEEVSKNYKIERKNDNIIKKITPEIANFHKTFVK